MTNLSTIKQWFRNGLKPTQEQFWAWMDSYWYKGEKIPQTNIEGLDKSLEAKAETSVVDAKANKDATGLDDDDIIAWKEALGVGELPSNIAKIDEGDKVGNAYNKEQVVELLGEKLDAPSGEGTSEDYPYVVGVNAENESVKLPAGDLGKNLANSNLTTTGTRTFTQAHIYTHNTAGYHYYITGLPDKSADSTFNKMRVQDANGQEAVSNGKAVMENLMANLPSVKNSQTGNYDLNFSEYLVFNPTTGKFAKSDRPQIVSNFNVPAYININHNTQVANVNWVPKPEWPQNLKETLEFVKNIQNLGFKKVQASEFVVKKMPNSLFPNSASSFVIPDFDYREGEMLYNGNVVSVPNGFRDLDYQANNEVNNALVNIFINKEFPTDKNWVFRFRHFKSHLLANNNGGSFIGFRSNINDNVHYDVTNDLVSKFGPPSNYMKYIANNLEFGFVRGGIDFLNSDLYIIKQGSIISAFFIDSHTGGMGLTAAEYNSDMKFIVFGINLNFSFFNKFYIKDISYWISE